MHNHSFGDYLLENNYITTSQFIECIQELNSDLKPSIEVAGIYSGLTTFEMLDTLMNKPEYPEMDIINIGIKYGFINAQYLNEYAKTKYPLFLSLAQILINKEYLNLHDFQSALVDYDSDSEIFEIEADDMLRASTDTKIDFLMQNITVSNEIITQLFFRLMFNQLYNEIGHDFTVLDPFKCDEYPTNIMVSQDVIRDDRTYTFAIDMNDSALLGFAERFAGSRFDKVDDLSIASIEDFINLHNGVFNVNLSNDYGIEASLTPPTRHINDLFVPNGRTYMMPVVYPFGVINILISADSDEFANKTVTDNVHTLINEISNDDGYYDSEIELTDSLDIPTDGDDIDNMLAGLGIDLDSIE